MKNLEKFINDQLSLWPLACENFRSLRNVRTRSMTVNGLEVVLQHNPARMISSAAKLDKESLKKRRCFLCRENRPPEQIMLRFEGRKGKKYDILINPYPIFANHLVIAMDHHCDQSIERRFVDMLDLSRAFQHFTFFYNGPHSGASAPDHHHFQAATRGQMPLERDVDLLFGKMADGEDVASMEYVTSVQDGELYHYRKFVNGVFAIRARTSKSAAKMFYRLLDCAPKPEDEHEPLFNVVTWYSGMEFRAVVVFRTCHRSHHYFSEGPDHLTMSPGCADMAGCLVVPVPEDFTKIDQDLLEEMLAEVTLSKESEDRLIWKLTRQQHKVSVGIMSAKEICFEILSDGAGLRKAVFREGKIEYDGSLYDELFFGSRTLSTMFAEPTFMLDGVTIGVGFHWERKENQKFAGALRIIVDGGRLTAINEVGVEDYLVSVISSEMKATASLEFLKAHAVISRSWLLTQMKNRREHVTPIPDGVSDVPSLVSYLDGLRFAPEDTTGQEHVRWYDKDDHKLFDVCADDHCQRYQGLTRAVGTLARRAVDETWGQVLMYDGSLCDTRFSKCCGGRMEVFSSCWEDKDYPYLQGKEDPYCGRAEDHVLAQVLNSYDMETRDFYRWQTAFTTEEISALFERRTGLGVGKIRALIPLQRGTSTRIVRLQVVGSKKTVIIGKELEIRRSLSESHLKSSAFEVRYLDDAGSPMETSQVEAAALEGKDPRFSTVVLEGRGWGHGVGLCQIGAAVMAAEGHAYAEILGHYYPGAGLFRIPEQQKDAYVE